MGHCDGLCQAFRCITFWQECIGIRAFTKSALRIFPQEVTMWRLGEHRNMVGIRLDSVSQEGSLSWSSKRSSQVSSGDIYAPLSSPAHEWQRRPTSCSWKVLHRKEIHGFPSRHPSSSIQYTGSTDHVQGSAQSEPLHLQSPSVCPAWSHFAWGEAEYPFWGPSEFRKTFPRCAISTVLFFSSNMNKKVKVGKPNFCFFQTFARTSRTLSPSPCPW